MQRPRSKRQLQVAELIKQLLSAEFMRQEFYDVEYGGTFSLTLTEAQMSPDLKNATVFFIPLGELKEGDTAEKMSKRLNKDAATFRKVLAGKANLKYVPSLYFKPDATLASAHRLNDIFNTPKVAKDLTSNDV